MQVLNGPTVPLTKVAKKTKEHKASLISEVAFFITCKAHETKILARCRQMQINGNIAGCLKWVRWGMLISKRFENYGRSTKLPLNFSNYVLTYYSNSSARMFFGRGAVMAKALGTTPEEEHRIGLSKLAAVCFFFSFPLLLQPNDLSQSSKLKVKLGYSSQIQNLKKWSTGLPASNNQISLAQETRRRAQWCCLQDRSWGTFRTRRSLSLIMKSLNCGSLDCRRRWSKVCRRWQWPMSCVRRGRLWQVSRRRFWNWRAWKWWTFEWGYLRGGIRGAGRLSRWWVGNLWKMWRWRDERVVLDISKQMQLSARLSFCFSSHSLNATDLDTRQFGFLPTSLL